MSDNSDNNKRIAKNTLVLYGRMLLTMGISFYTTRLVLENLGVSDYGIYNVVGGVVSMLYIVTTTLTEAISRFLTFGLGEGDLIKLKETFSTAINILLLFSVLVLILGESVGLWFMNTKLNIETDRLCAANWIFHISLISFILEMCSIPYNSLIVAHEKMGAFAFVTIADTLLKFLVAVMLVYSPIDRLVFYGLLLLMVSVLRQTLYMGYSYKNFEECQYKFVMNKDVFVPILSFAGFKILSVSATMIATTGVNIVLNMFYGTVVNAAKGVASQLQNYAGAFTKNFMMALNPQITKTYAQGNMDRLAYLVYKGSTFSYLLLFVIAFPLIIETEFILSIWLKTVPMYTKEFIQYTLLGSLIQILFNNVVTLNNAIGRIREYEIVSFFCYIMVLPFSYVLLKAGYSPVITVIVFYVISICSRLIAFKINSKYVPITFYGFFKHSLWHVIVISAVAVSLVLPISLLMESSWMRFIIVGILSTFVIVISAYLFAFNKSEQKRLIMYIQKKMGMENLFHRLLPQ